MEQRSIEQKCHGSMDRLYEKRETKEARNGVSADIAHMQTVNDVTAKTEGLLNWQSLEGGWLFL